MATTKNAPRFWAGGHQWGDTSRKNEFIAGNFWEHGYPANAKDPAARITWERFRKIRPGDWFAIKGYGGKNQLRIWYVGRVLAKDEAKARIDLQPLQSPSLYRDTAPPGPNWFDTLVPIDEPEAIDVIFPDYFPHSSESMPKQTAPSLPLAPNTILYGPPGTGKTYSLHQWMSAYKPANTTAAKPTKALTQSVLDSLRWTDLIALAMHSFGRPVLAAELAEHPYIAQRYARNNVVTPIVRFLWAYLQTHAVEDSKTVHHQGKRAPHLFDKDSKGAWFLPEGLPEDLAVLLPKTNSSEIVATPDNYLLTTFHQSYSYEDFVEGIRPRLTPELEDEESTIGYTLEDGLIKQAVSRAIGLTGFVGSISSFCELSKDARQKLFGKKPARFALFIDEINRGNVSRVFGELITLIEADKRLGAEHELIVTLPGSRQLFGVPSNLDIIATMNSADRSVEALDTALRRRFAFVEVSPDPSLLDFEFEGKVHAGHLLTAINNRIHRLYDRDHQIGHAYFLDAKPAPTLDALRRIFAVRILPLLQEYFYGDWTKIGLVLGDRWVTIRKGNDTPFAKFTDDAAADYDDRLIYELADPKDRGAADFRAIYGR
jgi:5-methylcytosine-specific restriction protein B